MEVRYIPKEIFNKKIKESGKSMYRYLNDNNLKWFGNNCYLHYNLSEPVEEYRKVMGIKSYFTVLGRILDVYGCTSFLNNLGNEEEIVDLGDIWFECPECGEPVLFCDYPNLDTECPICENYWEIDDEDEEEEEEWK